MRLTTPQKKYIRRKLDMLTLPFQFLGFKNIYAYLKLYVLNQSLHNA